MRFLSEGYVFNSIVTWGHPSNGAISAGFHLPGPVPLDCLTTGSLTRATWTITTLDGHMFVFANLSFAQLRQIGVKRKELTSVFLRDLERVVDAIGGEILNDEFTYALIYRYFGMVNADSFRSDLSIGENLDMHGFTLKRERNAVRVMDRLQHAIIVSKCGADPLAPFRALSNVDGVCIIDPKVGIQCSFNLSGDDEPSLLMAAAEAKEILHEDPELDYFEPNNFIQTRQVLINGLPCGPPKITFPVQCVERDDARVGGAA